MWIAGYLVAFFTLNFVVISEIWWEPFNTATSYTINLVVVAIVSLGCTGKEFYFVSWNTSYLKCAFYTKTTALFLISSTIELLRIHLNASESVHAGGDDWRKWEKYPKKIRFIFKMNRTNEILIKKRCIPFVGIAGLWVSINRILTKSLLDDERSNTSMFFVLSNSTILMCFLLNQKVRKTDFVQFYITLCQERNRITLEPTEDVGLVCDDYC